MKANIKATNVQLTPIISDYLDKKLSSLERFVDKNDTGLKCDVELEKTTDHHRSGNIFRAEIKLCTKGVCHYVEASGVTINAAIDEAKDEMQKELRRVKSKQITVFRRGAAKVKNMIKGLPIIRRWR